MPTARICEQTLPWDPVIDLQERQNQWHQDYQSHIRSWRLFVMIPHPEAYKTSPIHRLSKSWYPSCWRWVTMDKITTHGRFNWATMAWDNVDLPEPELPAMPMIQTSAHGLMKIVRTWIIRQKRGWVRGIVSSFANNVNHVCWAFTFSLFSAGSYVPLLKNPPKEPLLYHDKSLASESRGEAMIRSEKSVSMGLSELPNLIQKNWTGHVT